tara:strand:- start:569 stop:802 length:234 start_codon:yes stop_codon:yes gene_type:complete
LGHSFPPLVLGLDDEDFAVRLVVSRANIMDKPVEAVHFYSKIRSFTVSFCLGLQFTFSKYIVAINVITNKDGECVMY